MGYIEMKPYRNNHKKIIALLSISLFIVFSFFSFSIIKLYETPTLEGKWRSEETGDEVTFLENGTVILDNTNETGTYYITSPNSMEYSVENYTFQMIYRIEDRKLYWGTDEANMECFKK